MTEGGFIEGWQSPDAVPGAGSTGFDWDAIEAEEAQDDAGPPDLDDDEMKRLCEAFLRIVQWQLRGIDRPSPGGPRAKAATVGIRAIALAFILNPALLGGKRNAAQIARELGVSRKTMSVVMSSARRQLWGSGAKQ